MPRVVLSEEEGMVVSVIFWWGGEVGCFWGRWRCVRNGWGELMVEVLARMDWLIDVYGG